MFTGKLTAGTAAAADRRCFIYEIDGYAVNGTSASPAVSHVKGVVGGAGQVCKSAALYNLLCIGHSTRVRRHGCDLLFGQMLHDAVLLIGTFFHSRVGI